VMEAVLRRPTKLRWTRVTTWILQKEDAQFLKNLSGSHLNLFLIESLMIEYYDSLTSLRLMISFRNTRKKSRKYWIAADMTYVQ
jgi:hypothetical protein